MTCNDYINMQKHSLLGMQAQDALHYLNPFGQLLFSQKWKWSQLHVPTQKVKMGPSQSLPSLKKEILIWFENLTATQKIAVTTINNSKFTDSFVRMLPKNNKNRLFNINSEQWIDGVDCCPQDPFFNRLIQHLKIAYLSEPILYIHSAQIMGVQMLNWLNRVSSSKIFEYASKAKKGEENPLWFSCHSYHFLQNWLVNQLQINIVRHFLDKNVPEHMVPDLQAYLKSIGRHNEASALALSISELKKKSSTQIASLRQRIKQQEEKFIQIRQLNLLNSMETVQKTKKKNKKKTKKNMQKKQNILPKQDEFEEKLEQSSPEVKEKTPKKQKKTSNEPRQEEKQTIQQNVVQEEKCQPQRKQSVQKNLIRRSPRRVSPEEIRSKQLFEQQINQKYSEQYKKSPTVTQSENVSDNLNSYEDLAIQEKQTVKRRRKRGKKENQKVNQTRQLLFSRLLVRQIDSLVDQLGIQTNSLYNHKIIAFERVKTFSKMLFPMANAVLFGSNAVGLSLPNSDVDILLTSLNCCNREVAGQILAQIAVQINAMGWVVSCSTYLWAKVPLVKLQIDTQTPFLQTKRKQDLFHIHPSLLYQLDHQSTNIEKATIKVDITINIEGITSAGFESTILMKNYIERMPNIQKLVVIFKYILSIRGFNSNFSGGIGSYCLFVMIAAFLKTLNHDTQDVSSCFQKLLRWYGEEFDNYNHFIVLREEGSCFLHQNQAHFEFEQGKVGLLKIVDPITNRLMSSSCHEYANIKMEFRRIQQQLKGWRQEIEQQLRLGGINHSQLQRIGSSRKSMDKWLNKYQQRHKTSLKQLLQLFN